MAILDRTLHERWLSEAKKGNPPDPVMVARLQYGLETPWYVRKNFLAPLRHFAKDKRKQFYQRKLSRGAGKSYMARLRTLYLLEYCIPFVEWARVDNKMVVLIGRDVKHVTSQNSAGIHDWICSFSPWLKTENEELWDNPGALKDMQIRSRPWTKSEMELTNGARIVALGWGQGVRGLHPMCMDADDILEEENAAWGESQLAEIEGAMIPALWGGSQFWVEGTPQRPNDDIYALLEKDPEWNCVSLPAYDETGGLGYEEENRRDVEMGFLDESVITRPEDWKCLNPRYLNFDALEQARGTTKSKQLRFEREYMLNPVGDETLLVHPDDMALAKDKSLTYARSTRGYGRCYAGLDPSTLKSDEAGIAVVSVTEDNRRKLIYLEAIPRLSREGKTEQEFLEESVVKIFERIKSVDERFKPSWVVEANSAQAHIIPLSKRFGIEHIRMEPLYLTTLKHKTDGFPMLRTVFEAGDLILPYGPSKGEEEMGIPEGDWHSVKTTDMFLNQLRGIRWVGGKIQETPGESNDLVAAVFFALKAAEEASPTSEVKTVPIDISTGKPAESPRPYGAEFRNPRRSDQPKWAQTARRHLERRRRLF